MKWEKHIVADPAILLGKPTIRGTRISIDLLLECLAGGWTEEMILESYPHITKQDMRAMYFYLREVMELERWFPLEKIRK
jgi:uncharacterized protein (DUF433 family)